MANSTETQGDANSAAGSVIFLTSLVVYFAIHLGAYYFALENIALCFFFFLVNALVRNGHTTAGFVAYWGVPFFTELQMRRIWAYLYLRTIDSYVPEHGNATITSSPGPSDGALFGQAAASLFAQLATSSFLFAVMCNASIDDPPEGMDQKAKWTEYNLVELWYWIVSGNEKLKKAHFQGRPGAEAA